VAVVVSDTSPIRALALLGRLELLADLFGAVLIPPAVAEELEHPPAELTVVHTRSLPFVTIRAPADSARVGALQAELDRGEAEAISLALEEGVVTILLDEPIGRAAARRMGLTPIGVLGILVRSKQRGRVDAVRPLLDRLVNEGRFFVAPEVRAEAFRQAGE
jgi:hypothetical protein